MFHIMMMQQSGNYYNVEYYSFLMKIIQIQKIIELLIILGKKWVAQQGDGTQNGLVV